MKKGINAQISNGLPEPGTPRLEIPEGFVTEEENMALAAAQDVIAKVLARYDGASRAAGRKPDCAPTATLKVNGAGAGWVINAHTPGGEAHGWTLEAALRNLADQTDAERLLRKAEKLRLQAHGLEMKAAKMAGQTAGDGRKAEGIDGFEKVRLSNGLTVRRSKRDGRMYRLDGQLYKDGGQKPGTETQTEGGAE